MKLPALVASTLGQAYAVDLGALLENGGVGGGVSKTLERELLSLGLQRQMDSKPTRWTTDSSSIQRWRRK